MMSIKEIPDTSKWQPREDAKDTLKNIFYKRCYNAESLILNKVKQEKDFNIDNFDSGLGVEDIIRDEFSKLLPERYSTTKGIVNDREGFTSGEHDILIFNKYWFPILKPGITDESRRLHFPIEGLYSIGEIKQTLTVESLDDAMRKLVIAKRLKRPKTGRNRIVENRELSGCEHGFTNPLYTFILAVSLHDNINFDDIFLRFHKINKTLKRDEMINSLCILSKGTIAWCYFDIEVNEWRPAMFYDVDKDLSQPILPIFIEASDTKKISFYSLIINLYSHLNNTILGSEDLPIAYGDYFDQIKMPPQKDFIID